MSKVTDVIESLQVRLGEEFGAIHQYQKQKAYAEHKGYTRRAAKIETRIAAETEHVKELSERILFLGGQPDTNQYKGFIEPTESVSEGVQQANASELSAVEGYQKTSALCLSCADFGTLTLVMHILSEEEEHELEDRADLSQIKEMGEDNWLSTQV